MEFNNQFMITYLLDLWSKMMLSCQLLSKGITKGKSIACCKWEIADVLAYTCIDCKENVGIVSLLFKSTVSVHFKYQLCPFDILSVHLKYQLCPLKNSLKSMNTIKFVTEKIC